MSKLSRQIVEGYKRDQVQAAPLSARDIPASYESITDEWLTNVLCVDAPGVRVTEHQLGPVDSGSTNRRRIHLTYNSEGAGAGLPSSIFCKATQGLANRLMLAHTGAVHGEVTFYRNIRKLVDIETPTPLFANYDPETFNSITILKDMGDDVEFCTERTPISRAQAESQIMLLARLHGRFFESAELKDVLGTFRHWTDRFDNVRRIGLETFCANGLRAAQHVIPPAVMARSDDIWPATLASVASHDGLPSTLNHGDVHLKNWYMVGDARMGLADWQVICRGHWCRDLAYTISTALEVEDRRAWERDLIALYLDRLAAEGVASIGFDRTWELYRTQLFSALAWWTSTLAPGPKMPDLQPAETSLAFIHRITHAIDDLDAFDTRG